MFYIESALSLALGWVCVAVDRARAKQTVFTYPRAAGCAEVDAVVCAQLTWLLDDVGIPQDWRHLEGHSVNTYLFINAEGVERYFKMRWLPTLGASARWSGSDSALVALVHQWFGQSAGMLWTIFILAAFILLLACALYVAHFAEAPAFFILLFSILSVYLGKILCQRCCRTCRTSCLCRHARCVLAVGRWFDALPHLPPCRRQVPHG